MLEMSIEWRGITLLPLTDKTFPLLHKWRNSSFFLSNLTSRSSVSFEDFKSELQRDFSKDRHQQFIIYCNEKAVGTIYSYSYNHLDKYSFVSIFTDEVFHSSGIGASSTILFCKYLFENFDLFKIYFDIYEYNDKLISLLKKRNIAVEGQFKKQHVFQNERFDVFRFAIYRQDVLKWFLQHKSD